VRDLLQQFFNKVSGRTVYVIGGGPSIQDQDTSLLKGKHVVVINSALSYFPDALAIYWADQSWADNNLDLLNNHAAKFRFHSKFYVNPKYMLQDRLGPGGCVILKRTGERGIDSCIDNVRGNNSGAHVLNLLYNCDVKKIVLLGYDMKMTNGKSHFHKGYDIPMRPHIYTNSFIPSIESMAEFFVRKKIEVINTSMISELKCFKKQKLEEVI
jgi:hypothetical protein